MRKVDRGDSTYFSPLRFLIITIGGIFVAEVVAMVVLIPFRAWPYYLQTLLDASIMILLIFPVIYYFSLRPLILQIEKRKQAEKSLHRAYDEMELRVQERTEELRIVNSNLEEEINVRRQAENALRQSEQRLRRAQEIAHLGSWELDLLADQLTWSDEVYRIFGLQPQKFGATYEAFLEAVHPDDRLAVDEAYSGSIREGRDTYEIEHRSVRRPSGEVRIVHEKCEHFRDENGQIVRSVGMVHDITERKWAEEALRMARDELELRVRERTEELAATNKELVKEIAERQEIERQLRIQTTAMETAANGIIITDCQGIIEWTNPALTQISGYEAHELIGQGMRLFQSGKHHADFYGQLWETILAGNVWRGEITNRRKDGNLYIEEQTITPVRNGNGQISHFIAIKQDVTERKLMYAQLEESNRELISLSMLERQQRKVAEILSRASIALSQTLDIQHVMETILDYIQLVLPADAAFLILSEGNDQFRVRGARSSQEQSLVMTLLNQSIDLLNQPVVKPFFEKQTSTLIRDSHELEMWAPPAELAAMHSWLWIPLVSTGKILGMVVATNLQADFFREDQVELAEAVVSQATVALQNAWLFEQVRTGRQRLQLLSRHLVEIQENERKYIARELHDETSQALTSLKLGLHVIEQTADGDPTIGGQVANLKILADEILESLHRLAMNLRPASLDHLGLVEALTSLVQSTGERSGVAARFKCLGFDQRNRLTEDIESSIYRIVQESLTNIVRHAKATCADVILEWQDDQIMIIVEDDGIGIDLDSVRAAGHLGLVGMQERTEMLQGRLLIDSNPNTGTTLVVEIPYAH
ncbi:MAG TPA: PAS domain S-box protein [Anaerolineales bacterium]